MRKATRIAFSVACILSSLAGGASAGLKVWTGTGPTGGAIRAVLVDPSTPSTIYIGTVGSGVFKSTDGGATWFPSDPGGPLGTRTVRSLVFGASGTIYAGADTAVDSTSGVFRSDNGGASWTALSTQPANRKVQALAWDGTNLYAGTQEETVAAVLFTGGVFKWNGVAWTQINTGLPNQSSRRVQALAIDSRTSPPVVYAGTEGEGVFKSINGGASWSRIDNPANQGFRSDCLEQPEILALAVDTTIPLVGATGAILYAGATGRIGNTGCGPGQGSGFFRYVPFGGAGCTDDPSDLGCWDRRMSGAFQALLPGTLSTRVWSIVLKESPTRIYIGTDIGVFTSNDSAGSWDGVPRIELPDDGLFGLPIRALGIDPTASCLGGTVKLYAGTGGRGMFSRCPNLPASDSPWTLTNSGLTALRAQAVAVGSRGGSKAIFAGLSGGGIVTSINNGATWQDTPENAASVRGIATDPTTPTTVYAATGKGVIRSLSGGNSWALASTGLPTVNSQDPNDPTPPRPVRAITIDPTTPTTLYAAVGGVFRSVNSGATWTSVNGNLPPAVTANNGTTGDGTVLAIVIDSFSPGVNPTWGNLYAATDGSGVWTSSDGGVTWTQVPGIPGADDSVASLALDPLPPTTLYAGTSTGKVFGNEIGSGTGFSRVGSPETQDLPGQAITSLVVRPGAPSRIFAGLNGAGVYAIASNGEAWAELAGNVGLSPASRNVAALAYDPQGTGTLYAATLGRGTFDFQFDSVVPLIVDITSPLPPTFSAGTSPLVMSGTVTGAAPGSFSVFWSTNRGRAGFANGSSNWSASVALEPGQNIVTITAADATFNRGTASITVTFSGDSGGTFTDVPPSHVFFGFIEALSNAGITGGCSTSPPQYCPDSPVRRDQMAVFLLRGIHGAGYQPPDATGTTFTDVPRSQPFAKWTEQLAKEGITGGCSAISSMYCPDAAVTRGQMAVFLLRAKHGAGYQPPAATGTMFTDVPLTHLFARWIEQLAREGITGGCGPTTYCPETTATRGQMAVFLVRTFNLPM